jgi:hypothetical protein
MEDVRRQLRREMRKMNKDEQTYKRKNTMSGIRLCSTNIHRYDPSMAKSES